LTYALIGDISERHVYNLRAPALQQSHGVGLFLFVQSAKALVQAGFYVLLALYCSMNCNSSRTSMAVCYIALPACAFAGALHIGVADMCSHCTISPVSPNLGEASYLLSCLLLSAILWHLLLRGLRFRVESHG
jgi:hypothetical protein